MDISGILVIGFLVMLLLLAWTHVHSTGDDKEGKSLEELGWVKIGEDGLSDIYFKGNLLCGGSYIWKLKDTKDENN